MKDNEKIIDRSAILLIIVAALGYFVDAYDLIVASVARSSAIVDLGLAQLGTPEHKSYEQLFEYVQSFGILLGGVMFGILGDKIGRRKVLYASIIIYSIANILNGMLSASVPHVSTVYCALRFICGFALAAELSVGIVMISETMKAKYRGYGSMIVVSFGILGCVFAAFLFEFMKVSWQSLFLIGGVAGLLLLFLRYTVNETSHFLDKENQRSERGSLGLVFSNKRLVKIFVNSILLGFPIYFFVSIPVKFAADYGKEIGLTIKGTIPIIMFYIALSVGDILANYLSQVLQSRKKVIYMYLSFCIIPVLLLYLMPPTTPEQYFYVFAPIMGFASGYWALLITYTTEQVGTNIRSTFATSVPNIIRSLFIPIQLLLMALQPSFGTSTSVFAIGVIAVSFAFLGNYFLKETWGRDLNFIDK
ncbi:MAG: MFS transporter [Bacteroidetes bacterium]|nr:MFS transporter [Bacteroidota bacterium]